MRELGISIKVVNKWNLEYIYKVNSILDMEQDMESARAEYLEKDLARTGKVGKK